MDAVLKQFVDAGMPVLPVINKIPLIKSHKFLDTRLPTIDEYEQYSECDYAIKTGNQQTHYECIDFDLKNDPKAGSSESIWEKFKKLIIINHLYVESTPSGGFHVIYSCDVVEGSQKLAYCNGKHGAVIETRGTGGYVVVAPSGGYKTIYGDVFDIPHIETDEAEEIKSTCRALSDKQASKPKHKPSNYSRIYDKQHQGEILDLLLAEGWTIHSEKEDKYYLTRPGKTKGISATLFKTGVLYVFTTGTQFEAGRSYSPFSIIAEKRGLSVDQMEHEVCNEIGESHVKDVIIEILKNTDKLKEIEVINALIKTIIDDMEKNGKFYNDGNIGYYFSNSTIIPVDSNGDGKINGLIYSKYRIVQSQPKGNVIFDSINRHSLEYGERTTVRSYCYYNEEYVYVDNFNGTMWKISDKAIENIENGTDGVLFLEENGISINIPIEYDSTPIDLDELFFNGLTFDSDNLSAQEQKKLFLMWVLSVFFMGDNKTMLGCIGEKGSGKTDLLKKILYMFFGNAEKLLKVPDDEKTFWTSVTNSKILIFDNADTYRPWLNDALALCATSGTVELRKLYLNNVVMKTKINCFIGLTSRTPKFTRDDVSDRLVLLNFSPFKTFTPEKNIFDMVLRNRNAFMSFIFESIKQAIPLLRDKEYTSTSRMADFESFSVKCSPETKEIFVKLTQQQRDFSSDTFTDLFEMFVESQPWGGVLYTPSDLTLGLLELAKKRFIDIKSLSTHNIAYKMKKEYPFCTIKKILIPNGKKTQYEIEKKQ
jgi:hypothetical protein